MNDDGAIDKKVEEYLINPAAMDKYLSRFQDFEKAIEKDLASRERWEEKRVFVTGVSGFVGSHLVEKLLDFGAEVYGLVRRHSVPEYRNLAHIIKDFTLVEGNLSDQGSIIMALKRIEPDSIFHLGAQSFVPTSFNAPIETYMTNVIGTGNLLEAVRITESTLENIHIACSSEQYGLVYPDEIPITEENPFRPQSPYGVSKVAAEYLALTHLKSYGIPVVITRGFNHTGPRRGLQFVTSIVARQVAKAIVSGSRKVIIGNPDPIRDFTDVRDMIQGYLLAVEHGKVGGVYNLGHGYGVSIKDLVKITANICDIEVEVEIDPKRYRPAEVNILLCDYSKASNELGYKPRIPLTKAMLDNVEYFKRNPHMLNIEYV